MTDRAKMIRVHTCLLSTSIEKGNPFRAVVWSSISFFARLVCSLIFLLPYGILQAQQDNIHVERTSAIYGLPNGSIKAITEDSYGYLWFCTREGAFRYDGYEFKAFRHDIFDPQSLSHPNVNDIIEDHQGVLWAATSFGLSVFDRRTEKFDRFYLPEENDVAAIIELQPGTFLLGAKDKLFLFEAQEKTFSPVPIQGVDGKRFYTRNFLRDDNNIWIGTNEGLLKYTIADRTCKLVAEKPLGDIKSTIMGTAKDSDHRLWIATNRQLIKYHAQEQQMQKIDLPAYLSSSDLVYMHRDQAGKIWLALANNGLVLYDPVNQTFDHFTNSPLQVNTLNNNAVTRVLVDRFENIWIGTANGISKLQLDDSGFRFVQNIGTDGNAANSIQRIIEDDAGTIYSKTPGGYFAKQPHEIEGKKIKELDGLVTGLGRDWFLKDQAGGIWLTVSKKGLFRKGREEKTFSQMDYGDTLSSVGYFKIILDKFEPDVLWLGTTLGLCRLNWKSGERKWFFPQNDLPHIRSNRISIFEQYDENQIWLYYTYSKAIGHFDIQRGVFKQTPVPEDKQKYFGGHIKDIAIGKDGNLWLASLYGLTSYNIYSKAFKIYGKKDGMTENELQAVLIDQNDNLWLSGHRFISKFDLAKDTFINYHDTKRMQNFQSRSRYISNNGNILFGSINGIYAFNPDELKKNPQPPELVLTNFKVNNEDFLLPQASEDTKSIVLASDQNNMTFEFSGLHYVEPGRIEYKCILEGYENEWRDLKTEHKVRYTNLSYGNYTFKVSAANMDGIWNDEGIVIPVKIKPAFWQTVWFRGIVFLIISFIIYLLYRNREKQYLLQKQKDIAEQSAAYKTRFLADISHEIRTPMNAIIGLSKLTMETTLDDKQQKFVDAIQESSKNLLAIINDLLDYTKLESGKFQFQKKEFNLFRVIKNIENTLGYTAQEKGIGFTIALDEDIPKKIQGDPIRLNQILINLIGNAIKFTPEGKAWLQVSTVRETERQIQLKFEVGDTGIGIPEDKLDFIFGSWNQVDLGMTKGMEGTGLGLAIAKQLVERQKGKLHLSSKVGVGTVVDFTLAFDKIFAGQTAKNTFDSKLFTEHLNILVVEDTYFNQMLIEEFLKKNIKDITITLAENGKVALDKLRQDSTFDIILMDVKMPVMDGLEATRLIRAMEDEKLKNMPIIAVTASAVQEQLDKCKAAGMNNYITKPIEEEDLLRKIYLHTQKQ